MGRKVQVRPLPGAVIKDIHDYVKSPLKKRYDIVILYVRTHNISREVAWSVLDTILALKSFIEMEMLEWNISISNLIKRTNDINAASVVEKANELSFTMQLNIVDNSNIGSN